jgi:hypothetical protein
MDPNYIKRIVTSALQIGAVAYPVYAMLTVTGLCSWFVVIDLAFQGKGPYEVYVGWFLIPMWIISFALAAVASKLARRAIDRVWSPDTPKEGRAPPPVTPTAAAAVTSETKAQWFFLVSGFMALVLGVWSGLTYYNKSSENVPLEPLNLADGIPPRSTHVQMKGMMIPSQQVEYVIGTPSGRYFTRTTHDEYHFVPVLPPGWQSGDSVMYFLAADPGVSENEHERVPIEQSGVLISNGLPDAAIFLFKKHGIKISRPPIVLEPGSLADLKAYIFTAFLAILYGLVAFPVGLVTILVRLVKNRRHR